MNCGKVWLITLCFISGTLEDAELDVILEPSELTLLYTDKDIHRIVNGIFRNLMISPHFLTSKKVQKDLRTYKYLRKAARENYKIYKLASNTSQSTDKKSYVDNDVNDTINDALNESFAFSNIEPVLKDKFLRYSIGQTRRLNNDEWSADLAFELMVDFLNKIIDSRKVGSIETKLMEKEDNMKSNTMTTKQSIIGVNIWRPASIEDIEDYRRFFKAKTTSIRNYSFMASIAMDGWVLCAGSIISVDTVVTAASCLQKLFVDAQKGRKLSLVTVRVGSDYSSSLGDVIPTRRVIFHPEYNPFNLRNNIVLLRLRSINKAQRKGIKRIPLDRSGTDISKIVEKDLKVFKVLGWGKRDSKDTMKRIPLSFDRLEWYDIEACKGIYTKHYVSDNNFCLGSTKSGSGACEKDLGTPALYQGKLIGITSFSSPECGAVNTPTVFVKIAPYVKWIDSVVNDKKITRENTEKKIKNNRRPKGPTKVNLEGHVTKTPLIYKCEKNDTSCNSSSQGISRSRTESDFEAETLNYNILSKIKRILTTRRGETKKTTKNIEVFGPKNSVEFPAPKASADSDQSYGMPNDLDTY